MDLDEILADRVVRIVGGILIVLVTMSITIIVTTKQDIVRPNVCVTEMRQAWP
jgi:hypothetical protein